MDVVQAGHENVNSCDETKTTENTPMTEALEKIGGAGVDSRFRRRSKYLSYPYTNSGTKDKDLPAETEVLRTPRIARKADASSIITNPSNGSHSFAKSGCKRFRNNWYKKFISCSSMSSSPAFINASSKDLLSGLYSKAVDCMSPIEDKSFDLVEWFFCRYRISKFHDEAELATSLVDVNGGKKGKPVGNDLSDTKREKKKKNNKMENAVRRKIKSLSGLSDVNNNVSTGDSTKSGSKLKQKRKVEEVTSLHQLQNAETTLNESGNEISSVPETLQNLSCLASKGKKSRPKKRKKMEAAQEHECAQFTGDSTKPRKKLTPKRKVEAVTSLHQLRNGETTLNESGIKYSSVFESLEKLSCLASEGKTRPKKREKMKAAQEHEGAQFASYVDAKSTECGSLVIDLQLTSPPLPVDIHEKSKDENKKELVFIGSNPEVCISRDELVGNVTTPNLLFSTASEVGTASQEGLVGNITNHNLFVNAASEVGSVSQEGLVGNITNHNLFVNAASEVGSVSQEGLVGNITNHNLFVNAASEVGSVSQEGLVGNITNYNMLSDTISDVGIVKNRMEKAPEEHPNTKHATEIPDLNSTSFESYPIRKELETVNFLSLELKSEHPRNLSACSRYTKTVEFDRVEDNGESPETCLFLQFAPGGYIPSKDDLLTTFCRFGPLKASETQLMKDTGSARIVFVRSTDAAEAFRSLEQNKPFGATLVDYRLQHLPAAAAPPVEQLVTPAQPNRSLSMPGDAPPPLQHMKKNLQMMTSMLENSGNNLSPQMRAKLDTEIKNLLRKVDSRAKV